jgi:hypothetical protein
MDVHADSHKSMKGFSMDADSEHVLPDIGPAILALLDKALTIFSDPTANKLKLADFTQRQAAVTAGEAALAERSAAFERESAAEKAAIEKQRAKAGELYANAKQAEAATRTLQNAVRGLAEALEPKRRAVRLQFAGGGGQSDADESLIPPELDETLPEMVSAAITRINAAHKFDDDAGKVEGAPRGNFIAAGARVRPSDPQSAARGNRRGPPPPA